jgi:protein-S-isoprenylcysteine O-methyltransferase Ste14
MTPRFFNSWMWLAWFAYWMIAAGFTAATKSSEPFWRRLQYQLILLLGFYLVFHDRRQPILWGRLYDSRAIEWAGCAMTLLGLAFSVWARLHLGRYWSGIITLKEGHRLIRTGPYQFVRHPIYTGMLFAALGSAVTASLGDAIIGVAMMAWAFVIKLRREETLMIARFGEEYQQFKREVPALMPLVY